MTTFVMEPQELDQWCWAAVGASVNNFFEPDTKIDQFEVAARLLGGPCGDPRTVSNRCDTGASLTDVFQKLTLLAGSPIVGPVSFAKVKQTIDGGYPIPVRIVWDDNPGNAHAVVITGYLVSPKGVQLLQVDDPFYDRSIVDYDVFVSSYHGHGRWERTYRVT